MSSVATSATTHTVDDATRQAKNLARQLLFRQGHMRFDLTPDEGQRLLDLLREFRQRRAQGEEVASVDATSDAADATETPTGHPRASRVAVGLACACCALAFAGGLAFLTHYTFPTLPTPMAPGAGLVALGIGAAGEIASFVASEALA